MTEQAVQVLDGARLQPLGGQIVVADELAYLKAAEPLLAFIVAGPLALRPGGRRCPFPAVRKRPPDCESGGRCPVSLGAGESGQRGKRMNSSTPAALIEYVVSIPDASFQIFN